MAGRRSRLLADAYDCTTYELISSINKSSGRMKADVAGAK